MLGAQYRKETVPPRYNSTRVIPTHTLGCLVVVGALGFVGYIIPWKSVQQIFAECMETHFSCSSPYFLPHLYLTQVGGG